MGNDSLWMFILLHFLLQVVAELEGLHKKSALLDDATVENEKLTKAMALIDQLERELNDCKEAQSKEVHIIAM